MKIKIIHPSCLVIASASVLASFLLAGCPQSGSKSTAPSNSSAAVLSLEAEKNNLLTHGQKVYSQNCVACHNPNPKLDGAVGPAISGSSLDLVSARVLRAAYPPGYKPKRPTGQMPAIKGLEKDIPALHAFLNQ